MACFLSNQNTSSNGLSSIGEPLLFLPFQRPRDLRMRRRRGAAQPRRALATISVRTIPHVEIAPLEVLDHFLQLVDCKKRDTPFMRIVLPSGAHIITAMTDSPTHPPH
jgi:hypothetical protein